MNTYTNTQNTCRLASAFHWHVKYNKRVNVYNRYLIVKDMALHREEWFMIHTSVYRGRNLSPQGNYHGINIHSINIHSINNNNNNNNIKWRKKRGCTSSPGMWERRWSSQGEANRQAGNFPSKPRAWTRRRCSGCRHALLPQIGSRWTSAASAPSSAAGGNRARIN